MANVTIVQQIHTRWTKASRGSDEARRRNAVPEVARIPVQRIRSDDLVLVHHRLFYDERDGFSKPREELRVNPTVRPLSVGCVSIATQRRR